MNTTTLHAFPANDSRPDIVRVTFDREDFDVETATVEFALDADDVKRSSILVGHRVTFRCRDPYATMVYDSMLELTDRDTWTTRPDSSRSALDHVNVARCRKPETQREKCAAAASKILDDMREHHGSFTGWVDAMLDEHVADLNSRLEHITTRRIADLARASSEYGNWRADEGDEPTGTDRMLEKLNQQRRELMREVRTLDIAIEAVELNQIREWVNETCDNDEVREACIAAAMQRQKSTLRIR